MGLEDEIAKMLWEGKSPAEIISNGYSKSTVYYVLNKMKEVSIQRPTREWNWSASATFDKDRYLPLNSGYVDLKLKNIGITDIYVSQAGIQFDWLGDKWLFTGLKVFLSPGEEKDLTRIYFNVPSDASLGDHSYRIGITTHVWYPNGWLNVGIIWAEEGIIEIKHQRHPYDVFLAHSVKNPNILHTISRYLDTYGIKVHIAEREAQPGNRVSEKISNMVDQSDCLLALLTKEGADSQWVNQEIGYAKKAGKRIIPVVEKGVEIKGFVQDIEWITFDANETHETLQQIVNWISKEASKKKQTQQQQAAWNTLISLVFIAGLIALIGAALSD